MGVLFPGVLFRGWLFAWARGQSPSMLFHSSVKVLRSAA